MRLLYETPDLLVYDVLDVRPAYARSQGIILGRHAIWIPDQGIKLPFQFSGRIQKYQHPQEESYPRDTVQEEVIALRLLQQRQMAPPIGRMVYVQTLISDHLGPNASWADPLGIWGYQMAPAESLPPGKFDLQAMKDSGLFEGSEGAWNDLAKPGNVINGYLIDMRRSWWDRIKLIYVPGPINLGWLRLMQCPPESWTQLSQDLRDFGQFPFKERDQCYQEYALDGDREADNLVDPGGWRQGERDVRTRFHTLGVTLEVGDSVVDIGCHVGGFLHACLLEGPHALANDWATMRHLGWTNRLIGLDIQPEYVQLARRVARYNGWNVCFMEMDVEASLPALQSWLMALLPNGVDHLFLLSLSKHFFHGDATLEDLLACLQPSHAYLESNAINEQTPWPLIGLVQKFGGHYLGDSTDRNTRRLYRIDLQEPA